jgi:hypothetical protein
MFPGTSSTTTVSFRSSENLAGVVVEATPSLADIISAAPASISAITANQTYQIILTLKAPPTFEKRSFGGTIHLRNAARPLRTYATPLTVNLRTDFIPYLNRTLGISLDYPTNLFVIDPPDPSTPVRIQTAPMEINLGGALPEGPVSVSQSGFVIGISMASTGQPFDVIQWIANAYPHSEVDTIANTTIGGIGAYVVTFKNEIGSGRPLAVASFGSSVLRFSYRSTFEPGSSQEQEGLAIFYSVLRIPRDGDQRSEVISITIPK